MKPSSTNVSIVDLADGRQVCLSYGVIVAAFIPHDFCEVDAECRSRAAHVQAGCACNNTPRGYLRTDARFSVTTSKHMNHFAGKNALTVPHADLLRLCAPVKSRL